MSIKIEVNEINEIFRLIMEKFKKDNIISIELEEDLYWLINTDNWDVNIEKPELEVGSIKEDWEYLLKCKNNNEIFSYIEFDRMATILRAISERIAPIN
ncbi:MAG: hypothetical protein V1720_17135 [bacterium]